MAKSHPGYHAEAVIAGILAVSITESLDLVSKVTKLLEMSWGVLWAYERRQPRGYPCSFPHRLGPVLVVHTANCLHQSPPRSSILLTFLYNKILLQPQVATGPSPGRRDGGASPRERSFPGKTAEPCKEKASGPLPPPPRLFSLHVPWTGTGGAATIPHGRSA